MSMAVDPHQRKTGSDYVFEVLFDQIVGLELLPGSKMSETEVAKSFGFSRQPVREAFTRLANMNLLLIRPQRATVVRRFSQELIANARFVRAAIELEVVRSLAMGRDTAIDPELKDNMKQQRAAIAREDASAFHSCDYQFHKLLCRASGNSYAFEIIAANKAQVDRLCVLSLTSQDAMKTLYADHEALLESLFTGDGDSAQQVLRTHLDRLSPTIEALYKTHRHYFD